MVILLFAGFSTISQKNVLQWCLKMLKNVLEQISFWELVKYSPRHLKVHENQYEQLLLLVHMDSTSS